MLESYSGQVVGRVPGRDSPAARCLAASSGTARVAPVLFSVPRTAKRAKRFAESLEDALHQPTKVHGW